MLLDLPPHLHERVMCSIAAAARYDVPANLILAVAEQEGGKPGQWVRNANGTHDVGAMQFNTAYLATMLARYGITPADVTAPGCYAYELASWRLRNHLRNDRGDLWTRAANYHSRTPVHNAAYRSQLIQKATNWAIWLDMRFPTFDVTSSSVSSTARSANSSRPALQTAFGPQTIPSRYLASTSIVPRVRSAEPQAIATSAR